jgi:hypothetical protein
MWGTRKEYTYREAKMCYVGGLEKNIDIEGTFLCWGLEKEYRCREGEKELKNKNKKIVMEKKKEQLNGMG